MSREQLSIAELLPSLDSSELQEAEQVRATVNQHLSTDKGGVVLSCLVEYYLDSSSSQAVLLLSSIREPHHKALLEKLNESLSRPGSRLGAVTLLGHLIRKQPPWVHHISHSPLLSSLLRCLKTDTDVVFLITGVLVLITLLPMIPQAGKQHIYDFFDVFGRLASWSYKNIGHLPVVQLVHLHAGVYSLFHRLYGMFPCNFISYLRLHYSMKENLDTFQEVVKPMLEHVRVHPELVTGTQDYELDPSRWRRYEVHDIIIECSRVSLDPLESSCEEEIHSSSSASLRPLPVSSPIPHLDLSSCSPFTVAVSSSEVSASLSGCPTLHTLSSSCTQLDDVTWSPSSHCGLSTPPPEPAGLTPSLSRTASVSGVKCPIVVTVPVTPTNENTRQPDSSSQAKQPMSVEQEAGSSDVINKETRLPSTAPGTPTQPVALTSTPSRDESSSAFSQPACSFPFFLSPPPLCSHMPDTGLVSLLSPTLYTDSPTPPYQSLFELTLPHVTKQFITRKTQNVLQSTTGEQENDREEDNTSMSPLKALDQMIMYGSEAHESLSKRWSAANKLVDRSNYGGKQQSMKAKGPAPGEESQSLRSQLLLVHSQLQYERFKRQQHAIRNRRLLRRVINTTVLEEHSVAMKAQLGVQDEEIRSLKSSLEEEQRRNTDLQQDMRMQTDRLHAHVQQLLQQQQEEQQESQRLQGELKESQSRLRNLEAELQGANNKAYNAEHQLTQLSLKLCNSEQLQQQFFLLNQQLLLLRETNRALSEKLEDRAAHNWTEVSMLQCTVGKEFQRLKDSDVQQRQKLEAANHRIADLENQLSKKEQLIQDQKKLMEDTKNQSRMEMLASESRCEALRKITQALQMEMLHLYSLIHLEPHRGNDAHSQTTDRRPNSSSSHSSIPQASSSSAGSIINGAVEALSTSPLHLPSCSSSPLSLSPIDSPLTVGSFLEQRARELFRPVNQNHEDEEKEADEEVEEAQPASPPLGQEAEEATPLHEYPQEEAAAPNSPLATPQRRLGIMDYDQSLPEF